MRLQELIQGLEADLSGDGEREIGGIAYDSRRVKRGDLFCCLKGYRENGHNFATAAIDRGAVALLVQHKLELPEEITQVWVKDSRRALAIISSRFYGQPSRKLKTIGITGTNGKTTTSYLLKSIYEKAGFKVGLVGTICHWIGDRSLTAENTTPESLDLQNLLSQMVRDEVKVSILEVSSHGLSLDRVTGIDFDCGVFTNLSRDHLDFHETMEEYKKAKLKLFALLKENGLAIVNSDDSFGESILRVAGAKGVSYGLELADFRGEIEGLSLKGTRLSVVWKGATNSLETRLIGRANVYNILCSFAVGCSDGIPSEVVKQGLEAVGHIPGRFELIERGQPFTVVVDYAHTPDALRALLVTLRELKPKKLISVFGCGGDRDRGKRPMMGGISTQIADHTIVTSDNPRSEDPGMIIKDIETGIETNGHETIPDRRVAIRKALQLAEAGDCVAIAGKGHEACQIVGRERLALDDREVASEILGGLGWSQ